MTSRNWLWIGIVVIVAIVIYLFSVTGQDTSQSGQPAPHALDQSQ